MACVAWFFELSLLKEEMVVTEPLWVTVLSSYSSKRSTSLAEPGRWSLPEEKKFQNPLGIQRVSSRREL